MAFHWFELFLGLLIKTRHAFTEQMGAFSERFFVMADIIHDFDGDHEDLEKDEIEAAVKAWEEYTVAELARKPPSSGSSAGAEKVGDAAEDVNTQAAGCEGGAGETGAAAATFEEGESVLADNLGTVYPAKIVQVSMEHVDRPGGSDGPPSPSYLVHYQGWKKRCDF